MISTRLPTGFRINWSRFCIITQSTPFSSECYFGFELSFLYCIIFTCNNSLSWACCRAAHTIFANGRTLSFSWKLHLESQTQLYALYFLAPTYLRVKNRYSLRKLPPFHLDFARKVAFVISGHSIIKLKTEHDNL